MILIGVGALLLGIWSLRPTRARNVIPSHVNVIGEWLPGEADAYYVTARSNLSWAYWVVIGGEAGHLHLANAWKFAQRPRWYIGGITKYPDGRRYTTVTNITWPTNHTACDVFSYPFSFTNSAQK
jgi:hypothetical protein